MNEKSIYNKILNVLEVAKSSNASTTKDFLQKIRELNQPIFYSPKYNEKKDNYETEFSEKSVKKTVRICQILDLLDENSKLTSAGKTALKGSNFNKVIAQQIIEFFSTHEIEINSFNKLITENFKEKNPILTTATLLLEFADTDIPPELFSKFLTLLVHTGYAKSSQARAYLHFG